MQIDLFKAADTANDTDILDTVYVRNSTPRGRLQWTKVSVPFPKGKILNETELKQWGIHTRLYEWKVIKWHFEGGAKHSVAIAQLKLAVYLGPNASEAIPITKSVGQDAFALSPSIMSNIDEVLLGFCARVKFVGDPKEYVAYPMLSQNLKVMHAGPMSLEYRTRCMVQTMSLQGAIEGPLSCTAYFEVNHLDPIIRMSLVFGNDTFERPISGGINIESIRLTAHPRIEMKLLMPTAYGVTQSSSQEIQLVNLANQFNLGDAQTVHFRVNAFVKGAVHSETDPLYQAYLAECEDPLYGFVSYESYKASKALNLYQALPQERWGNDEQARQQFEQLDADPLVSPKCTYYLGQINQVPGSTGAQPDFSSTVPPKILAAIQAKSSKLLFKSMIAVDREALRPSYYFKNHDRMSCRDYPNLLFWSGRPHYDPSWYTEYPDWRSRTTAANFSAGSHQGWTGHDNQHISNNHLRTMYELTGDPYLQDLCHYYVTILYWNFFTRRFNSAEAERCGRSMKEALAHALLFPDSEESQMLIPKIGAKMKEVFLPEAQYHVNVHNLATVGPFDACLPQFLYMGACPTTGDKNILAVCWQSPFHMEFLTLMLDLGFEVQKARELAELYWNGIEKYFDENGVPYTYVVLTNHSNRVQGGIGLYWWSGWAQLARHMPANSRISLLKDVMRASFGVLPGRYLSNNDGWQAY